MCFGISVLIELICSVLIISLFSNLIKLIWKFYFISLDNGCFCFLFFFCRRAVKQQIRKVMLLTN